MKIHVTDREGKSHSLDGPAGPSLMALLRDHNFVLGSCEGNALCGTCHVFVDPAAGAKLPPRSDEEIAQLQQAASFREDSSRLACQIRCAEELTGLRVVLAPYE